MRLLRVPCGGKEFIPKETLCEHIPEWVANVGRIIEGRCKRTGPRSRYSLINSHYWDAGLAGQALANRLNVPHLHTPHSIGSWKRDNMSNGPACGDEAEELERKYNFRKRIREEKVVYDECDGLVATTQQQRDILCNGEYDVPPDKIFIVPPGYDDTRFFPVSRASRQALKIEYGFDGPIILALGRMAHNKGFDLLIRAMPVVFQRVKGAKLLLAVGSTEPSRREREQIDELKALAGELGIREQVVFRDFLPDQELADYYRIADVFALSSRYEPFGMAAVEAMACGTPTVITTEGGLWELVTWGLEAIYANPFDPEAFGHAVCSVLQHPRLGGQLAKYGSQKARARFTWTGVAQQILRHAENLPLRIGGAHEQEDIEDSEQWLETCLLAT